MNLRKIFRYIFVIIFLFPLKVFAQCSVCTVAIGVGVGLCRYLGIDDLVTGLWIGAALWAITVTFDNWLSKKYKKSAFRLILLLITIYLLVFVPLYYFKIIGGITNSVFGVDKLLFSSFFGIIILKLATLFEQWIRQKRNGKVLFYYQKVIIPIASLLLASFIINYTLC